MNDTIETLTETVRGRGGDYVDFRSGHDDHRAAGDRGADYERFSAVKAAYDPDDRFGLDRSIAPAERR